jgi:hypothetical protein
MSAIWHVPEEDKHCVETKCSLNHDHNIRHARTLLRSPWKSRLIAIDRGMASLICNLWKHQIKTSMCCENNSPHGFVWIEFHSIIPARKFLDRLLKISTDHPDFLSRMLMFSHSLLNWRYSYYVYGVTKRPVQRRHGLGWWSPSLSTRHSTQRVKMISIRFPHRDYAFVLAAFQ